jgi:phage-related protein
MYEIVFFEDNKGNCQVDDFLERLPISNRAKIEKWMEKLGEEGPDLPRPYADTVRGKIRELRIQFGSNNYRFLYFFFGKTIIITHGFLKKTREVPPGEINKAEKIMQNFHQRIKGGEIEL